MTEIINFYILFMFFIKGEELAAVCVRVSDDDLNERVTADPWELPEFTHTTIPWKGTRCIHIIILFNGDYNVYRLLCDV